MISRLTASRSAPAGPRSSRRAISAYCPFSAAIGDVAHAVGALGPDGGVERETLGRAEELPRVEDDRRPPVPDDEPGDVLGGETSDDLRAAA